MKADIKEIVLELEEKWPVDKWQVAGIHIWPYIRVRIFIHFYREKTASDENFFSVSEGKTQKAFRIAKIPFEFMEAFFVLLTFFGRLNPKKLLFFGSHIHRSKQEGKYFNRFFDSMVDHHNLQNEVYMLEFQKVLTNNFNQQAVLPLHYYLDKYKFVQKFRSKFWSGQTNAFLEDYTGFLIDLEKRYPPAELLRISERDVARWAQKIRMTTGFFTRFYKITKPEKIIMSSYYGFDDLAAAIVAAHQLGIKTVDFQHGPQRNMNLAYSNWNKVPPELYNTMPIEYWNWDEDSKKNIDQWGSKRNISTKVIGQPYLSYWIQKFSGVNQRGEQFVCYSLQPTIEGVNLQDFFPNRLISLISDSPFIWVLRFHPRSNYSKRDVTILLDRYNVEPSKYRFEEATETPLPQTLVNSAIHVTNWSGCLIEASILGVPSVCIHHLSLELYSGYIDNHLVYYLNPDEPDFVKKFITCLSETTKRTYSKKTQPIPNPLFN